jgi:hypothetical protein
MYAALYQDDHEAVDVASLKIFKAVRVSSDRCLSPHLSAISMRRSKRSSMSSTVAWSRFNYFLRVRRYSFR